MLIANKVGVNQQIYQKIAVFDLTGETYKLLDFLEIPYKKLNDLTEIRLTKMVLLIVANLDAGNEVPYSWEDVRKIAGNGTNVLLIHPGEYLKWLLPDKIASVYEQKGRIVNMHIPENGTFDNIEPMELAWWQQEGREKPRACRRSFRLKNSDNIQELATYLRPHVYLANPEEQLYEMSGSPLIEITEKKGKIVACEMEVNQGVTDPVAAQLFINLIKTYSNNKD